MKEILRSTLLDFEKSFFHIEYIKSSSGEKYVTVEQTKAGNYEKQKLKINLSDLPQIISVLQMYQSETFEPAPMDYKKTFSQEIQRSIISIYLKGIGCISNCRKVANL